MSFWFLWRVIIFIRIRISVWWNEKVPILDIFVWMFASNMQLQALRVFTYLATLLAFAFFVWCICQLLKKLIAIIGTHSFNFNINIFAIVYWQFFLLLDLLHWDWGRWLLRLINFNIFIFSLIFIFNLLNFFIVLYISWTWFSIQLIAHF